jgi:hypothetical protein
VQIKRLTGKTLWTLEPLPATSKFTTTTQHLISIKTIFTLYIVHAATFSQLCINSLEKLGIQAPSNRGARCFIPNPLIFSIVWKALEWIIKIFNYHFVSLWSFA